MPTLHNPAEYDLTCYRLGLTIKAGATVEISDEDADALDGGPIFIVEGRKGSRRKAAEASQEDAQDAEEPEADEKAAPQRKTAKRGGKQAEVTTAPETEKRG